ncbi:hypothetical protein M514_13238, partial [Trichuris suis]
MSIPIFSPRCIQILYDSVLLRIWISLFKSSGGTSKVTSAEDSPCRNLQNFNKGEKGLVKYKKSCWKTERFSFVGGTMDELLRAEMARAYMTVGVLFCVNLLNYMDRFTIA